jgi:Fe2+ transport system protein B
MATPISPKALGLLLACGATLPVAAFFAAFRADERKYRVLNVLSYIFGLIAISIIGVVLYHYR